MKHVIQHHLDLPTAKRVVDHAFADYKRRFPDYRPTLAWASDHRAEITFSAKGIKLAGAMQVEAKRIELELDVPFLMRPFQKRAIELIEREVRLWVGKAEEGAL